VRDHDEPKIGIPHAACGGCTGNLAALVSEEEGSEGRAIRPEVLAFARVMSAKIDGHNHDRGEHGWRTARTEQLVEWLRRYYNGLLNALAKPAPGDPREVVLSKAANVANLAMMIADVCGGLRAPAPPPSTGDAPGPSEECHVEGCGWRWPRGSGLGCPQHPSPRAQTGTDEGRGVTDADLRALVAEGRKAGRAEAAAILMTQEADSILDDLTASMPIGDTGDYSAEWEREKVLALFDATGSAALSLIDRLDGAYWEATARAEDALRSAALRREERAPRLAALEEAARVVDGLAAHTSREDEEQRAWLYAYAKAAAAIRALSSPATNPDNERSR
jgi:hypothetical protein